MAIQINLAQLKREKEVEWNRDIKWNEIMKGANISRNTLANLLSDKSSRVDKKTLDGLCQFFDIPPGPIPFIIYGPDGD